MRVSLRDCIVPYKCRGFVSRKTLGSRQEWDRRKNTMASHTLRFGIASVFASLLLVCASSRSDSNPACFDLTSGVADITHIFIASECAESPSDFFITVNGTAVPVPEFHTNGGPCPEFPRDVWFQFREKQVTATVCVTVPEDCPEGIQVYGKAGDECLVGTMP